MGRVPPPRLKPRPPGYCPPTAATAATVATGGDRLDDLIAEIDILKDELGLGRWCNLATWCSDTDPGSCDGSALDGLLMALSQVWADSGKGDPSWMD